MKARPIRRLLKYALIGAICMTGMSSDQHGEKITKLPPSHVEAVDFTNMTFTVTMKTTNLTVRFTSETRFFLNLKPAISKDLEAADHVHGTIRKTASGMEAVRVHIQKLSVK